MGRKKINKEWTSIRISWKTKEELLRYMNGRQTDDEVLKEVLRKLKKNEN